jgi:hypothetical protein
MDLQGLLSHLGKHAAGLDGQLSIFLDCSRFTQVNSVPLSFIRMLGLSWRDGELLERIYLFRPTPVFTRYLRQALLAFPQHQGEQPRESHTTSLTTSVEFSKKLFVLDNVQSMEQVLPADLEAVLSGDTAALHREPIVYRTTAILCDGIRSQQHCLVKVSRTSLRLVQVGFGRFGYALTLIHFADQATQQDCGHPLGRLCHRPPC